MSCLPPFLPLYLFSLSAHAQLKYSDIVFSARQLSDMHLYKLHPDDTGARK